MSEPDARPDRIRAANLANQILRDLGAITALVPRGPLRDKADDEAEHMAALAEMIHDWQP